MTEMQHLRRYLEKNTDITDRAFGAATSRSRLTAGCYRSRFVVAMVLVNPVSNAKAAAGAARRRRERHVATGGTPASALSVFFSK